MIYIINYGLGNIKAFLNIYERLGISVGVASCANDLNKASKIILPGVGSFDHAIELLNASGLRNELEHMVLNQNIPILGVCLGMQIMGNSSEEGKNRGLGLIPGVVRKFNCTSYKFKTHYPHMGWNSIKIRKSDSLLKGLVDDAKFYFLHSYYFNCEKEKNILCKTEYEIPFISGISSGRIYGTQFHPEKSHSNGELLLKNFANLDS